MKNSTPISAVMVHVSDWRAGLNWYRLAFADAVEVAVLSATFGALAYKGILIEIVASDEKVTSGPSGSIIYWAVADFAASLNYLLSIGARLYRGPIQIEDNMSMCQVQDPWGNCIGLRGRIGGPIGGA